MSRTPRFRLFVLLFLFASSLLVFRQLPELTRKSPDQNHPAPEAVRRMQASAASQPAPVSAAPGTANPQPPAPLNAGFLAWTERFLAASPTASDALLPEGVALARQRLPLLAELIRKDPRAALAAAIPRNIRNKLPAEITAELETLVSARAELAVLQSCLYQPGTTHDHADDFYRATVIDRREYRVHVYGSRLADASLPKTSLIGIGVGRDLAVSDSRYRVLDAGETVNGRPLAAGELAAEADGRITSLASPADLPALAAGLLASETNPVVNAADSGSGSSRVTGRPTQAWTHGDKKLLVIRVDFSDLPGTPANYWDVNSLITPDYVENVINGPRGVRDFLYGNSFGKTNLIFSASTDLTPVLRLPRTAASYATSGDNFPLHDDARAAAAAAGYNLANYDRICVVFSYQKLSDIRL